jgi:hypothetical protein
MKESSIFNWKNIVFVICTLLLLMVFYKICIKPNNVVVNIVNDCCCCGNGEHHNYNETIPPLPPSHAMKNNISTMKATGCPIDNNDYIFLILIISLSYSGFALYKANVRLYKKDKLDL